MQHPAVLLVREAPSLHGVATATLGLAIFVAALFVIALVVPGKVEEGQPLADGTRIRYKLNGMAMFVATHMAIFVGAYFFGVTPSRLLVHFWDLLIAANVVTFAWMALMFRSGARKAKARGEASGGLLADLWYGIELNPALLGVDLKTFAYQPSLIGLGVLNVAFAFASWESTGSLTVQMVLYQAFWWVYLFTHYLHEDGVLSMWDIIAEKFGFMLLWGDLVVVPFFYCITGWWLLAQPQSIAAWHAIALISLFTLGLWIFRGSNRQKNRFKRDRNAIIWGRPAQTLGGRLLVSGFWGIGRKLNYTGEIMVYTSFAATAGFASIFPYLLPLWLCSLLPHRAWRDDQRCREKYGALWDEYCKVARFRMIPFVY